MTRQGSWPTTGMALGNGHRPIARGAAVGPRLGGRPPADHGSRIPRGDGCRRSWDTAGCWRQCGVGPVVAPQGNGTLPIARGGGCRRSQPTRPALRGGRQSRTQPAESLRMRPGPRRIVHGRPGAGGSSGHGPAPGRSCAASRAPVDAARSQEDRTRPTGSLWTEPGDEDFDADWRMRPGRQRMVRGRPGAGGSQQGSHDAVRPPADRARPAGRGGI